MQKRFDQNTEINKICTDVYIRRISADTIDSEIPMKLNHFVFTFRIHEIVDFISLMSLYLKDLKVNSKSVVSKHIICIHSGELLFSN